MYSEYMPFQLFFTFAIAVGVATTACFLQTTKQQQPLKQQPSKKTCDDKSMKEVDAHGWKLSELSGQPPQELTTMMSKTKTNDERLLHYFKKSFLDLQATNCLAWAWSYMTPSNCYPIHKNLLDVQKEAPFLKLASFDVFKVHII